MKNYINRPEYFFRPLQIYRRVFNSNTTAKESVMPWGLTIKLLTSNNDALENSISKLGIYDLSLTEVLWRLIQSGEIAIDIGANIGYVTSLMSVKVGKTGKVWCFDPNPEVYEELNINIENWQNYRGYNNIYSQPIALSDNSGTAVLNLTPKNRGEVFIDKEQAVSNIKDDNKSACVVTTKRLDEFLEREQKIGVLKIDVEGHELEVLQGAGDLIRKQNIRDIVFEEHHPYPSPLTQFLEENGYTVFRLWKGFWKPQFENPCKNLVHPWEPPNYLATCDPNRALRLIKDWGWKSLVGNQD